MRIRTGSIAVMLVLTASASISQAQPSAAKPVGTSPARQLPDDGKTLFEMKCGLCHIGNAPGTISLKERYGSPDKALLAQRTDLQSSYVKAVVRTGVGIMPPFTRVDLTDQQLDRVADYLGSREHQGKMR